MLLHTIRRHILVKMTAVKIFHSDRHDFIVKAACAFLGSSVMLVDNFAIGVVRVDIFGLQHVVILVVEISLAYPNVVLNDF